MKKLRLLSLAVFFFSASASAGLKSRLLIVPDPDVISSNATVSPGLTPEKRNAGHRDKSLIHQQQKKSHAGKTGFRSRLALWMTPKRWKTASVLQEGDIAAANKKAKNSMIIGGIALGLGLLPYFSLIAFPLGIIAIVSGSKAKKMGATRKTGLGLGIAALVVASAWLLFLLAYSGAIF